MKQNSSAQILHHEHIGIIARVILSKLDLFNKDVGHENLVHFYLVGRPTNTANYLSALFQHGGCRHAMMYNVRWYTEFSSGA